MNKCILDSKFVIHDSSFVMKIAIIGYGSMGKEIKCLAEKRGHQISAIVDNDKDFDKVNSKNTDVAIEFSEPSVVVGNIKKLSKLGVNTVVGTTGWYSKLTEVKKIVKDNKIGFLWSSNFSIGVNIFFKLTEQAAKLVNKVDEFDIWGTEIHHLNKVDSPSGTAKTLEDILLKNIKRKTKVVEDKLDRKIKPNEIHFSSTRGGLVNFGHTIGFDSEADTVKIEHIARNRKGYVLGAVKAAEWLKGKKGYFEMDDFLGHLLK